jgi:hypothetical protein
MAKVRFLQSVYLIAHDKVMNFNDELDLDEKLAKHLQEQGYVDILIEDEVEAPKKAPRKRQAKKDEE